MRSVQPLASYIIDVAELRSAEVDKQPSRSLLQLRGPDRWPLQKFSLAVKALKSAFRNVHSPQLCLGSSHQRRSETRTDKPSSKIKGLKDGTLEPKMDRNKFRMERLVTDFVITFLRQQKTSKNSDAFPMCWFLATPNAPEDV